MKLRNAVIYRYKYFAPLLAALAVFSALQYVLTAGGEASLVDFVLAAAKCIFFFAFGIMSFKKPYKYLLQNGYKNAGIYESFILFVPSTLIFSAVINIASYFAGSRNADFSDIFSHADYGVAKSDTAVLLIFKIIACAAVFALPLILGYICAMFFYKFNGKIIKFLGCLLGAAIIAGTVLLVIYAADNGYLCVHLIPAFVMILMSLTVIFASLGYFLCTRIELERSRS